MPDPAWDELKELLRGSPFRAVEQFRALAPKASRPLLSFAEGAALNSRSVEDRRSAVAWAEVSVAAYEILSSNCSSARSSCEQSAMMLRVYVISRFGQGFGSVNNPEIVADWFKARMPFPAEQVLDLAKEEWRSLGRDEMHDRIDEIRALRGVKNRLGVLAELERVCPEVFDADALRLLAIRDRLP